MSLATPNSATEQSNIDQEQIAGFNKRQHIDDSLLVSDPYYNSWYQIDEKAEPSLPTDFAERLGIHLMVLIEKHNQQEAINIIGQLLERHIINPKMFVILFKVLRLFLGRVDRINYLAVIWQALISGKKKENQKHNLLGEIIDWLVDDYHNNKDRNIFIDTRNNNYKFSFLAVELGDNFIALHEGSSKYIDITRNIVSMIVDAELEKVEIDSQLGHKEDIIIKTLTDVHSIDEKSKKISSYNDTINYLDYRASDFGQIEYNKIGVSHQPEGIRILRKNIINIRNHSVELNINNKIIIRDKEIKEKLLNRSLTDEELVASTPIFKELLHVFYLKKRFKHDFRCVELVKAFANIIPVLGGLIVVVYSFIDPAAINIYQGFSTFIICVLYARYAYSHYFFKTLYPIDYSKALNNKLRQYFEYFQKMNKQQLLSFGQSQIHHEDNKHSFFLIPELIIILHEKLTAKRHKQVTKADVYQTALILQNQVDNLISGK